MSATLRPSTGHPLPRRGFLLAAAGAAATALAACSNDSAGPSTGPSASAAGFPVTVPGKLGPTTVPAPPTRVVAAGYTRDTDLALALGAPLVGYAKNPTFPTGLAPWQKPTGNATGFDTTDGLPFTAIANLHPDLVLASDDYTLTKDWANLGRLAPTLGYANGPGEDGWQEMAIRAGQVLGRKQQAEQLVNQVQQNLTDVRNQHPEFAGRTFTFGPVQGNSQVYTITTTTDAATDFLGQLGFTLSPKVTNLPASATPGRAQISSERLDLIDADVVILTYTSAQAQQQLEANPLFQQLSAVRRGSYVALDMPTAVALAFPSVLSIPYGLDATVPKLAAAVAKA